MKLAEALIERAELQKKNGQLIDRIKKNSLVQEGDSPAENPEEMMAEFERNMGRFLELVQRINKTNSETSFSEGISIADAIAVRDSLRLRIWAYREFYEATTIKSDRYNRNEIKFVRCTDAKSLQENINTLSKEYREIDTKLQGLNWMIELL